MAYRFVSYESAKTYLESLDFSVGQPYLTMLSGCKSSSKRANLSYSGSECGYIETPIELLPDEEWVVQIPIESRNWLPHGVLSAVYGDTGGNEGWENRQFWIEQDSFSRFRFGSDLQYVMTAQGPESSVGLKTKTPVITFEKDTYGGVDTAIMGLNIDLLAVELRYAFSDLIDAVAQPKPNPIHFNTDCAGLGYLITVNESGVCNWLSPVDYFDMIDLTVSYADNAGKLNGVDASSYVTDSGMASAFYNAVNNNVESGIVVEWDGDTQKLNFNVIDFNITLEGDVVGSATVNELNDVVITTTLGSGVSHAHDDRYVRLFGDDYKNGELGVNKLVALGQIDSDANGVEFRYDQLDSETTQGWMRLYWDVANSRNVLEISTELGTGDVIDIVSDKIYLTGNLQVTEDAVFDKDVVVHGNLNVEGDTISIETENLNINDNIITVNSGEPGDGVTAGEAGIEVDRGTSGDVSLLFVETDDKWYFKDASDVYHEILTVDSTYLTNEYLPLSGGTMTGDILLANDPTENLHPVTMQYLTANYTTDASISSTYLPLAGGTMTGGIVVEGGEGMSWVTDGVAEYSYIQQGTAEGDMVLGVDSTLVVKEATSGTAALTVDVSTTTITPHYTLANGSGLEYWHPDNFDPASKLNISGGTMSGYIVLHSTPTNDMHAVNKKWVDDTFLTLTDAASTYVAVSGDTMTGTLSFNVAAESTSLAFPHNFYVTHKADTPAVGENTLYIGNEVDNTNHISIGPMDTAHSLKTVDVRANNFQLVSTDPVLTMAGYTTSVDSATNNVVYNVPDGSTYTFNVNSVSAFEITTAGGSDIVEFFETSVNELPEEGTLMAIGKTGPLVINNELFSKKVVGFVSYHPAITLGGCSDWNYLFETKKLIPIALAGQIENIRVNSKKYYDAGVELVAGLNGQCEVLDDQEKSKLPVVAMTLAPLKPGENTVRVFVRNR